MNYELAKELRNAGFPTREFGLWMTADNSVPHMIPDNVQPGDIISLKYKDDAVYIPTLTQLIEACGKDFYSLTFTGERWSTVALGERMGTSATTPEEAVARLWLALQNEK